MREIKPLDIEFDENSLIGRMCKEIEGQVEMLEEICGIPKEMFGNPKGYWKQVSFLNKGDGHGTTYWDYFGDTEAQGTSPSYLFEGYHFFGYTREEILKEFGI